MDKTGTDISQINKYLNGELDARAMHQLELQAQSDPFLMEALEGYEQAAKNQDDNLHDIATRLQQRVAKKERRIIPYKYLAVAASVLLVLTIGGLWVYKSKSPKALKLAVSVPSIEKKYVIANSDANNQLHKTTVPQPAVAQKKNLVAAIVPDAPMTEKDKDKDQQLPLQDITLAKPSADNAATKPPQYLANSVVQDKKADTASDSTPLNEMVVMQYSSQKKKDVLAKVIAPAQTNVVQRLQGRVEGVRTEESTVRTYNGLPVVINGRVIGKDNNLPLTGVSVRVVGTNINTITDHAGNFSLPVTTSASKKMKLNIATVGYKNIAVTTGNHDSIKTIALAPKNKPLNEPVVIGDDGDRDEAVMPTSAYPLDGWLSFYDYLKENAVSPDNKKGIVKLKFTVGRDGKVGDIKVTRGLSQATDQKAVDLIKNSPGWIANPNGKPEKISIRIRFR